MSLFKKIKFMQPYNEYMYSQPILKKIISLNKNIAHVIVFINNEEVELLFKNDKPISGEFVLPYNFVGSSDGFKYKLSVKFKNNGRVLGISEIKRVFDDVHNLNPASMDSLRSTIEKNS